MITSYLGEVNPPSRMRGMAEIDGRFYTSFSFNALATAPVRVLTSSFW